MGLDLRSVVFAPVLERMEKRADSLRNMKRFERSGIEGWFKVEVVAALGDRVQKICNNGPDLLLSDGTGLELKAATNFDKSYFLGPLTKYSAPCLFLGDGSGNKRFPTTGHFEVIGCEVISDGVGQWIVALVSPRQL